MTANSGANYSSRRWLRREVLAAGVPGATLVLGSRAEAVPLAGPLLLFVGELIIGEVVLGVLRAYDIDIGRDTEQVVRCWRRARAQEADRRRALIQAGESESGGLVAYSDGFEARRRSRPEGIWVPGSVFWAATGESKTDDPGDLSGCRCGYPVQPKSSKLIEGKDYYTTAQRFEKGEVTVTIARRALPSGEKYIVQTTREQRIVVDVVWRS